MKIETRDRTVEQLLKDLFVIPRFQRPYSWEQDQVQQFWNDTVLENAATDYFIGSVVVYKDKQRYAIVDGQQRITTMILLMCALRNAFTREKLKEQARGIQATIEKKDYENKKQFVLETETSYPYLQDKILSDREPQVDDTPSPEEQLLAQTFKYLSERIDDAVQNWENPSPKLGKAESILRKIRDRILGLKLITVELDNEDDACLIFETLNTRGKDLQVSDLVKNHLSRLMKSPNKGLDALKHNWDKLRETFATWQTADLDLDTFLHHYWLSRAKYVTAKNLYASMKQAIQPQTAADTLADLVRDAKLYRQIGDPSYGKWRPDEDFIRLSLHALTTVLRMRQPYPLILSLMRCYRDKDISKKQVEQALWAIECFHFKFNAIASMSSSGGLSLMYASLAQRLANAKGEAAHQKVLKEIKEGLRSRVPTEEDFMAGFAQLRNSSEFTKQRKLVKYTLARIHDHLSGHDGIVVNYDKMTIEHVAPQNAENGDPEVSSDHVAMIGNQLLCDDELQNKLKNHPFAIKKKALKESGLATAKDIVSSATWNEKAIEQRTERLGKLAYRDIWAF